MFSKKPRLHAHLRQLIRRRAQIERFLDRVEDDQDLQRTHADTLAQLDLIDQEIAELQHAFFLANMERILLWLLPVLTTALILGLATVR